jgi:hypothetical protein
MTVSAETGHPDDLVPGPLVPRGWMPRPAPLQAQRLLERYRVLAMALATRAVAIQWDTGLIAATAGEKLAGPGEPPLPLEQEVLGLIGVTRGRASAHVEEAERGVAQAMRDVATLENELAGQILALDQLTQDFELSAMARMILMLVAAPQLWGSVHQLYRIALNDSLRSGIDEYLVQQLLGPQVNPHLVARALDPDGALLRGGLIIADPAGLGRPLRALRADPLVLAQLRGEALDVDPERALALVDDPPALSRISIGSAAEAEIARWAADRPGTPLVVRGRRASGRKTLLASLAAAANRRLAVVELQHLEAAGDLPAALARALVRCGLAGWIPCVSGFDAAAAADRDVRERIGRVLDDHRGPLVLRLLPDEQPVISPGYRLVELPPLSESQRLAIWREQLASHSLPTDDHARFAAKWRLGPGTICRVVDDVAAGAPAAADLGARVDAAVAQHLQHRLGDVAERIHALPDLADLVLPGDILDSLTEFLARTRLGRQVLEDWGMSRIATTSRGLTALFQGPPGTGKTMVAGALARELGLELYRVDVSRIMSKWIGETERNLANVFSAAEEGHAVILFDEADSLFTKRTEVKSSNDRHANLEVNYLLQRLDSFVGIAILTTNLSTAIDPAFKRRLAFRITFPIPDEDIREQLWRKHLPPTLPTADDLDLAELARKYQLTGGAVRNCALRAAFLAASEDQPLGQDHLLRAIRLEYRAFGKLAEGGPLE